MGKLRIPTTREFRKHLREEGFEIQAGRGKGDHELWKHSDGRWLIVDPSSDPPSIGLFKAMLKQAGISEKEYR
jgi:predicted RNA binding protein YcfA (HicA-like mRNA interferase family)